nr:hypothetical protein [Lachnospiraceae bacterium]
LVTYLVRSGLYKDLRTYIAIVLTAVLLPVCANMILIANSDVTYHSLMRYQWAFIPVILLVPLDRVSADGTFKTICAWVATISACVLAFSFAVTDNIAYENLNKKYEKTYAYTLRLLDRIEETEGYYRGMPVNMIGVVGTDSFPVTDLTEGVTAEILGTSGDFLLYRPENYRLFMENYLGASVNFLPADASGFYYEDWYVNMHSFPAADSIVIRDGVMYIKTENQTRN